MKKILISAIAFLFAISGVFAQEAALTSKVNKTPEQRATNYTKRMTKELSLDAAQQERVKAINLDKFKQIEEAKSITTANPKDLKSKIKAINDNWFSTLKGILSAEQFTKLLAMKEEAKEKAFGKK
jgi:hypothetical protein